MKLNKPLLNFVPGSVKNTVYKIKKFNVGKPKLEIKTPKLEEINEREESKFYLEKHKNEERGTIQHNSPPRDIHMPSSISGDITRPPWKPGNLNFSPTKEKPPKAPLFIPTPKTKVVKKCQKLKAKMSKPNELERLNLKTPVKTNQNVKIDYIRDLRKKRLQKRANSEQKSLNYSYKYAYDWSLEMKGKEMTQPENFHRIISHANVLEDRAIKQEKVMLMYDKSKA